VLEVANRVGGKCRTVEFEGRAFDVGANYVTAAYKEVRKLARKFGAKLYTESASTTATVMADGTVAFQTPRQAIIRNGNYARFGWAALRYFCIRLLLRRIIDRPGFARVAKHPGLCLSFRDWLKSNKLSALEPMFEIPITIMGYGYLDEIPAPYALKFLGLATYSNLLAVGLGLPTRWPKRFVNGFERLWRDISAQLDVRLGADITRIDRDGLIRVYLRDDRTMEFDYLLLACPLNTDVTNSFLSLSDEERDLFNRIIVNPYVVASCAIPDLRVPRRIVGMSPTPKVTEPWAMTQQFVHNDFVQFYTRLGNFEADSRKRVLDAIDRFVARLGAKRSTDFMTYDEWHYFPHVTAPDFRDGFYDRLAALQGQSNTFYCGGIAAFELVETVVRYSKEIVEMHF
jgi:Flavin containing amine oxidoreductase